MAMSPDDARHIINAIQREAASFESVIDDTISEVAGPIRAIESEISTPLRTSRWYALARKIEESGKEQLRARLAELQNFTAGAEVDREMVAFYALALEGLVWLATGERNRGLGVLETANARIHALMRPLPGVPGYRTEELADHWTTYTQLVGPVSSGLVAVREGRPDEHAMSLDESYFEICSKIGPTTIAAMNTIEKLRDIFSRAKYDVREALGG